MHLPSHDILPVKAKLPSPWLIHKDLSFLDYLMMQPWIESVQGFHQHSRNTQGEIQPAKQ